MILTNLPSLGNKPFYIVGGYLFFNILLTVVGLSIVGRSEPVAFVRDVNKISLVDIGTPSDEYANAVILDFADKYWTWFAGNRRFRIQASMANMAPGLAGSTMAKVRKWDALAEATYLTSQGAVRQILVSKTSPVSWSCMLVMEVMTTFGGINDGVKSSISAYRFTLHANKPTLQNPFVVVIDSMQQIPLPTGFSDDSPRTLDIPENSFADFRQMEVRPTPERQLPFEEIGSARENPRLLTKPK